MAILHKATLTPSKLELLSTYVAAVPSFTDFVGSELAAIGSYRFDDPAGSVGIETHLLTTSSEHIIQMPLTYHAAPRDGAEAWLIGTMEHSVLGRRWVYNACGDPVYAAELVRTILTGGSQVGLFVETPDGPVEREPVTFASGSGSPDAVVPSIDTVVSTQPGTYTTIRAGGLEVVVRHVLDGSVPEDASATLSGTWVGVDDPVVLAFVR